jgi:transmembrane sensor
MLMNDAVRDNQVTGRFRIASLDAALSQLENTFDLNARSLPGGLLLLS